MTSPPFDPYHKWLGVPPAEQPPTHYRLLGVAAFEADADVIDAAANRQMAFLQTCANGPHAAASQRLLTEVAAARLALLSPAKKAAYDEMLRANALPPPRPEPANPAATLVPVARPKAPAAVAKSPPRAVVRDGQRPRQPATPTRLPLIVSGSVAAVIVTVAAAVGVASLSRPKPAPVEDAIAPDSPTSAASTPDRRPSASEAAILPIPLPGTNPHDAPGGTPPSTAVPAPGYRLPAGAGAITDEERLQGVWACIYEEASGRPATGADLAAMNKTLTVAGRRMTIKRSQAGVAGVYDGDFELDPAAGPRRFDFAGAVSLDGGPSSAVWLPGSTN